MAINSFYRKGLGLNAEAYLQQSAMLSDWRPNAFLRYAVGGWSKIRLGWSLGFLTARSESKEAGGEVEADERGG